VSQAQSTTTVLPQRTTDLRRLPVATTTVATAPIVQQSPNGLYKLSIGDTGIELLGPQGSVKISDAGIEIGGPNNTQITIRGGQTVKLEAGTTMDIKAAATMDIRASSAVQITAAATASLTGALVRLGCTNGRPAARLGDQVNTTASPAVIAQGSPTVLVC
jgi:hypothetical protein